MLASLRKLVLGDVLTRGSRDQLERWLLGNVMGAGRLKAGIPAGWRIGDKPGSGGNGAMNDIGIPYPPGRAPILVAASFDGSKASLAEREAVLAEVCRVVVAELSGSNGTLSRI